MGDFKISYQISLPESSDADAFEKFMTDRYLPAIHTGPTRVGQVTGVALWRGVASTHAATSHFLIQVDYGGLATGQIVVDDKGLVAEFESYEPTLTRLGAYNETVIDLPVHEG